MSSIIIAILVFTVVVLVHELGHFFAARRVGILVEEFSIGMGPRIFSIKRGETLYSIKIFPIGGSCRMLGEDYTPENENPDEIAQDQEQDAEVKVKELVKDERSYFNKPVQSRMLVIISGVIMNLLLALLLSVAYKFNNSFYIPAVRSVIPDTPAYNSGLKPGDRIVKVNDTFINIYNDFDFYMRTNADGSPVLLTIIRGNERLTISVTPEFNGESYKLGFYPDARLAVFTKQTDENSAFKRATVGESLKSAFFDVAFYVKSTLVGITQLFTRQANLDDMAGPVRIVTIIGDITEDNLETGGVLAAIWGNISFAILLSANLAVFNLLPIPALDGGRMVFLIIEFIRKKPINPEKEGMVHFVSFVLLMIFAVFVAYNDIIRII